MDLVNQTVLKVSLPEFKILLLRLLIRFIFPFSGFRKIHILYEDVQAIDTIAYKSVALLI
jgi:hypothetical protein